MKVRVLTLVVALTIVFFASTAMAENLLVLTDGSTISVAEMTVRGSRVEVLLPGSDQPVAYTIGDIDLEASGLAPEQAPTTFSSAQKFLRGGFEAAIAAPPGEEEVVTITDQDVGHVRKPTPDEEDEAEDDTTPPAEVTSLLVSNLQRQTSPSGVLTVTGTVTNSGTVSVTAIAITGDAQDGNGASLGRGTTGISLTLAAGEAAEFSINIPVNGTVSNVKVTAVAALSEFSFEPVATPGADEEDEDQFDAVSDE